MKFIILHVAYSDTLTSSQDTQTGKKCPHAVQSQHPSPCILPEPSPGEDTPCTGSLVSACSVSSRVLTQGLSPGTSPPSSLDNAMDHVLESLDSESEHNGIFLSFGHSSGGSEHSGGSQRQSAL